MFGVLALVAALAVGFAVPPRVWPRMPRGPHVSRSADVVAIGIAPRLPAGSHAVGIVPGRRPIPIDVILRPRHAHALAALAAAVSNPRSPDYRHYLPPGAFSRRFGAAASEQRAIATALHAAGLPRPTVIAGGLALHVRAPARVVERALRTTLRTYRLRSGSLVYANTRAPRLRRGLAHDVVGILGLQSLAHEHADLVREAPAPAASAARQTSTGPSPNSQCALSINESGAGYTAQEIASAYAYSGAYAAGDTGAAATVALIEFAPFRPRDIAAYARCYAGVAPHVRAVPVDGGPGHSGAASQVEAELDIEDLLGLAPGAKILVYEGPNDGGNPSNAANYDTIARAVDQDAAQIISTSWGECELAVGSAAISAESALFEQAALQGQTVVAAAGDAGSEDCYNPGAAINTSELAVDDPASQPYVTGVGGTELSLHAGTAEPSQAVWNSGTRTSGGGAGGGGLSSVWPMPRYQKNTPAPLGVLNAFSPTGACRSASGHCREVPDLSANAGTPYAIYCTQPGFGCSSSGWTPVGGTSAAAPTIAALFALADSSPSCLANGRVGFANPALYAIASGSGAATAFTDVTHGNNDFTRTNGGRYPATAGYDLASGLGTPVAGNGSDSGLIAQLCAPSAHATDVASLPTPIVSSIIPARGRSGASVTIVGRNLGGATQVRFGSHRARFVVLSADHIRTTAPAGARGTVRVRITTPHAASPPVRTGVFTYLPGPVGQRAPAGA